MASKWYLEQQLNKIGLSLSSDFLIVDGMVTQATDTRLYTIITGKVVATICMWSELQTLKPSEVHKLISSRVATDYYKDQAMQGFIEQGIKYVRTAKNKEKALAFFVDMNGEYEPFMGKERTVLAIKTIRFNCEMSINNLNR